MRVTNDDLFFQLQDDTSNERKGKEKIVTEAEHFYTFLLINMSAIFLF